MSLSNGDPDAPVEYSGPGEIHFDPSGTLEMVLYDQHHVERFDGPWVGQRPGLWTPEVALFDLEATDLLGRTWRAEDLRPDVSATYGQPGAVLRAWLHMLSSESLPERGNRDWVWLYFAEQIDIPANVTTVTTIQEGDGERPRQGFERNLWNMSCPGLSIRLRPEPQGFEVNALADEGESIQPGLDTRIQEALWFTLAQPLTADVVQYRRGDSVRTVIHSRERQARTKGAHTPHWIRRANSAESLGEMLCKYLAYVLDGTPGRFHPLSILVRKALRARDGTIEEGALGLCVAIEGVLHFGFQVQGKAARKTLKAADQLEEFIAKHLETSPIRDRVVGFLDAIRRPSPRTALKRLVTAGSVTQRQRAAWERLRHVGAHGQEYGLTFRELYETTLQLEVLLAVLVFRLIGYRGPYTDYGTPGWPTLQAGELDGDDGAAGDEGS